VQINQRAAKSSNTEQYYTMAEEQNVWQSGRASEVEQSSASCRLCCWIDHRAEPGKCVQPCWTR